MLAYLTLLRLFVHGGIGALDFETLYLYMFKNDPTRWPAEVFHVLDDLFADVDAYCGEPSLRGPEDLDEQQLLTEARTALTTLEQLATPDGRPPESLATLPKIRPSLL